MHIKPILSVMAAVAFGVSAFGVDSKYEAAAKEAVAKGHPRLFADAAGFDRLKADVAKGGLRALAARRVCERADILLDEKPLERKVIGRRLLHVSRQALYRISTLAMAYRLTGERKYLERGVAGLKAMCAFSDWNPSHFLDTGEMSLAVSLGYDWMYDGLSDADRREIRAGLLRNGLKAGQAGGWWTRAENNWGQVCRAGMIAASLSLAEDPELFGACARMLGESVEALPRSMAAMAPNGCYPEGTGYWHYGVSFNVFAIAMLESACGTDFGLCDRPGFLQTADYPNLVTGPTGLTVGYSDCGSSRDDMQALWWFAKRLKRPDLISGKEVWMFNNAPKRGAEGWLPPVELLWMDDRAENACEPGKGPLVWSSEGSVPIVVLRTGWGKQDAFAGLKGGKPNSPHGHMDSGNFVLDMGGVRWVWELPHEDYNRIEQMKTVSLWDMRQESGRWSLLRLNTFGHSVPCVDGAQQAIDGFAKFTKVGDAGAPSAELDLSELYPAAKSVTRDFALAKDGRSFTVRDRFTGLKPGASVRWQFILKAKAEAKGARLALSDFGRRMTVVRSGSGATDWRVDPAEGEKPLNSPNPGFSIAGFTLTADANGVAETRVEYRID